MSDCSACTAKRIHTEDDWKNHPLARHGFVKEHGFTSEGAKLAHEADIRALKEKENGHH